MPSQVSKSSLPAQRGPTVCLWSVLSALISTCQFSLAVAAHSELDDQKFPLWGLSILLIQFLDFTILDWYCVCSANQEKGRMPKAAFQYCLGPFQTIPLKIILNIAFQIPPIVDPDSDLCNFMLLLMNCLCLAVRL